MSGWVDPAKDQAKLIAAQIQYGLSIKQWLARSLPGLEHHPAAIAAVIRLHHVHGKGTLTAAEHGPVIRAAVADFDERLRER